MNLSRRLTLLGSTLLLTSVLQAADIEDEDVQALRDWINSKRMITVRELGGQLSISGDVHAELQSTAEVKKGKAQRGRGTERPNNRYDVEINLMIDYRTERSWLSTRLRFDNDAGLLNDFLGSGKSDRIKLERAYWGYRLIDGDRHTMDIEAGRRGPMTSFFDSRLQFVSNFDGISFKDSYAVDNVGDIYYQMGAFIVNENKDRGAYIGEAGILNIANTGLYTKYSLIDWDTKQHHACRPQYHFIVSQATLGYKWIPQSLDRPVTLYLAGLYNHRAKPVEFKFSERNKNLANEGKELIPPLPLTNGKKANYGAYLGFSMGALKQAGDWALDVNYQVLAAQCIPDFDVSGIGMGSSNSKGLYGHEVGGKFKRVERKDDAEGNVNYRGFELTFQYLISNNLNMWQQWKQSITLDKKIGPFRHYKQYEIDFIYSF